MVKIIIEKAKRRGELAATEMYFYALNMAEKVKECAKYYNLTEEEVCVVVVAPILIYIKNREGLSDQEQRSLMKLMFSKARELFEHIIGPLDDEEDEEDD